MQRAGRPVLWHTLAMLRSMVGLSLLLAFAIAPPAVAAPIDDANAAYQRGNYAAA